MPTCHKHGCELIAAIVPVQYGLPALDDTWDLASDNPHHGFYELGGCCIEPGSPRTRRSLVCPQCMANMEAGRERRASR